MPSIDLIPMLPNADPEAPVTATAIQKACIATQTLYGEVGYVPPWIGYLARSDGRMVGTCTFKSPPSNGKVEIGYFTFFENEGRGIATEMVAQLIAMTQRAHPGMIITAQKLNQENASNAILRNSAFSLSASVLMRMTASRGNGSGELKWKQVDDALQSAVSAVCENANGELP